MLAAKRTATFTESVIREMTRIANLHEAVNLSQGFPDFPMPEPMKEAACTAINADINQYAVTWGTATLRNAIAEKYRRWYQMEVDPNTEVTVTCGATEAMASVFMALIDPGDEVIVLEPFYENYGPDAILAGAKPVFVPARSAALGAQSRPAQSGVLEAHQGHRPQHAAQPDGPRDDARRDFGAVAELCLQHDAWAITDSPYEHMVYSGHHHEIATWPGMRERTVTISSLSKTFSCTGWRIGYAIAPTAQTNAIRKVHDFLTVGAPAPLQAAAAVGFAFDADYYNHFTADYKARRDFMVTVLHDVGFEFEVPEGAYYIFADFSKLSDLDDVTFAKWMTQEGGVATVPGSSFYSNKEDGRQFVRFAFCKKFETLKRAEKRLRGLEALLK